MHLKRKTIPTFWPISRSGTKYLAFATHEQSNSMPLIVVMRDLLKLVKNRKELMKALNDKKIIVNGKLINETKFPLLLFDSLSIPSIKKNYEIVLNGKKFGVVEISDKEAGSKVCKIIGKRLLSGKKFQLNLSGGKNILTNEKLNVGDFVIINHSDNKITKKITLEKGTEVIIVKGKHAGKTGKIREILKEGENTLATITGKEELKVNINTLFALE